MKPACRVFGPLAMFAALDGRAPAGAVARHVSGCLRCRAEEARGRVIRRALAALATERYAAPRDLTAGLARAVTTGGPRRRIPVVPVAVAAASVLVALTLRRRLAAG